MITIEKIHIYKKFKGDIDSFARVGTNYERALINSNDWSLIDSLIQDMQVVEKGLASEEYNANLSKRLSQMCDSEKTIGLLKTVL